jgi:hypothetical protein
MFTSNLQLVFAYSSFAAQAKKNKCVIFLIYKDDLLALVAKHQEKYIPFCSIKKNIPL